MKSLSFTTVFCAIIISLIGCQKSTPTAAVSSPSISLNSDTGIATGQFFGITFSCEGAEGVETKNQISGNPKHSSHSEVTLAPDLTMKLQTLEEGKSVSLKLNDKIYPNLSVGDKVEINKAREVTVNGVKRDAL